LPDPDTFGGVLALSAGGADWEDRRTDAAIFGEINWPFDKPDRANYRMLGLADLARALAERREPRTSGTLALHVLEIMEAILNSAASGDSLSIHGDASRPAAMSDDEAMSLRT
jgi:predicted dehydrogenase